MKKRMISVICGLSMAVMALAGMNVYAEDVIKIGVFEPQTGENGGGGLQELQGARYANEIRPTVTIDGTEYKVELDEVDNKSDKTEAVTAAQKLVADGVVAVIGSYGSGVSIAAGPTFAEAQIPAVGCSCTNPQVTNGCDYYFNFFIKRFETLGGTIATTQQFQTNQSDFKAILTEVKASGADAIFAPSSITTAPLIIKQARELGIEVPFMAGDTWYNQTIIDNAGAAECEGTVVSTFFDENDDSNAIATDFVSGYKAWLNEDQKRIDNNGGNDAIVGNSALCFDTYNVICDALEAAGSTEGEAVKAALAAIDGDYVTGHITFDAVGDADKDSAYIDIAKDGKFEFLKIVSVGE